jgi:L-amino acid N-acyltransferase YncA
MIVRDARQEDMAAIVAIYNEDIHTTTSNWSETPQTLDQRLAWFEARSSRGFPTLVADDAGVLLGVAAYGDFRDSLKWPGYRFTVEHSVHVLESAWGRGVGGALMKELLARAAKAGIHVMIGGIDGANTRSIAFHERLGFREAGRLPQTGWKHEHWLDLVFMQRFIQGEGRDDQNFQKPLDE